MSIKISDHFTYKKLLLFVLPSVLMMVFTSIYGVVDGFFVSNYAGKTAFAAVNFILPLMMILGGLVQTSKMANSEPPAKFSPVSSGTSSAEKPFCAACAPSTKAKGIMASSSGMDIFRPRLNSENLSDAVKSAAAVRNVSMRFCPIKKN